MMSMPSSDVPGGTMPGGSSGSTPASTLLNGHGLGEVARLVDVGATGDRDVIGEQLEWNDREHRTQRLVRVGNPADIVGEALDLHVAFGGNGDYARIAGATLHDIADELVVRRRPRRDRDERTLGVEQRDGPMLQLAGGVALGVDVAHLLELECALERR